MTRRPADVRVLLICGSTRPGSSNLAALRAVTALDLSGLDAQLYEGLTALPAFILEQQPVPPLVRDLLAQIAAAGRGSLLHSRVRRRPARQHEEPARLDGRRR